MSTVKDDRCALSRVNGDEAQVRLVSTWTAWIHSNDEEGLLAGPDDNRVMFVHYFSSDSSTVRARASVRARQEGRVTVFILLSRSHFSFASSVGTRTRCPLASTARHLD